MSFKVGVKEESGCEGGEGLCVELGVFQVGVGGCMPPGQTGMRGPWLEHGALWWPWEKMPVRGGLVGCARESGFYLK